MLPPILNSQNQALSGTTESKFSRALEAARVLPIILRVISALGLCDKRRAFLPILSDKIAFTIYTVADSCGKGRFHQTSIYEIQTAVTNRFSTPTETTDITHALERMYRKSLIDMCKYRPGSTEPTYFLNWGKTAHEQQDVFFSGSIQICILADGRPDFESKSEIFDRIAKPLIFVSCGQYTPQEIALGEEICKLIENTGVFSAYFAQQQQTLQGLTENIFAKLGSCSGFVAVLHQRGRVNSLNGDATDRASLFIEQEIAIVSFLMATRPLRKIDVAGYIHRGVLLEGIRKYTLLNPIAFTDDAEVVEDFFVKVSEWAIEHITH
jgi:hypothetical protein